MTGLIIFAVFIALMVAGVPIGIALMLGGAVGIGLGGLGWLAIPNNFYSGIAKYPLLALPMFVLVGAIFDRSGVAKRLVDFAIAIVGRGPGMLPLVAIAVAMFLGGISGSGPANAAAVGGVMLAAMARAGYPPAYSASVIGAAAATDILIPPSITFILYGIATETSIGRLFLAGIVPGILLTALFMAWTIYKIGRSGFRAYPPEFRYSWREKLEVLPKVAPFLFIVAAVMYVLYGGVATPSEAAGVGAALCVLLAVLLYRMWDPRAWWEILRATTRESVMIMMIIAASVLFGYMLTSLYLTQTLAQAIADANLNRWVLMALINLFLLVCGCFIPPAGIILMTAPILLPIVTAAGFDPVWFGVIVTINMEIGLITPPVGLNLFVVNSIVPDVPTKTVLLGSLPYVLCMVLAIAILCLFPGIATWLPDLLMGPVAAR